MIDMHRMVDKIRARARSAHQAGNQSPKFIEGLRCAANMIERELDAPTEQTASVPFVVAEMRAAMEAARTGRPVPYQMAKWIAMLEAKPSAERGEVHSRRGTRDSQRSRSSRTERTSRSSDSTEPPHSRRGARPARTTARGGATTPAR